MAFQSYQQQLQAYKDGTFHPPVVHYNGGTVDYFYYLVTTTLAEFKLLALGMTAPKNWTPAMKTKYFELKGRTYKERVEELKAIKEARYKEIWRS